MTTKDEKIENSDMNLDLHKKMLTQLKKQRQRHKRYYVRKKTQMNESIKEKCNKIYYNLSLMGAIKDMSDLDEYIETLGELKFKCKCFDILYDINDSIDPIYSIIQID